MPADGEGEFKGDPLPKLLGYYCLQKENSLMDFSKLIARQAQEVRQTHHKDINIHTNL